jgi:hypothetical protein
MCLELNVLSGLGSSQLLDRSVQVYIVNSGQKDYICTVHGNMYRLYIYVHTYTL